MQFETGFSPRPLLEGSTRQASKLKDEIERARTEVVTGLRDDPSKALRGRTSDALTLQGRLSDIEALDTTIALAIERASSQQTAIATARNALIEFANSTTVSLQSASVNLDNLHATARAALETVFVAVGASYAGRSLFGGDIAGPPLMNIDEVIALFAAETAGAVSASDAATSIIEEFDSAGGLFETVVYRGGDGEAPAATIEPGEIVRVGAKASDADFRALLRDLVAITVATDPALGHQSQDRRAVFEDLLPKLRSSADSLATRSATIGLAEVRLVEARTRNSAERTSLSIALSDRLGRDVAEAATELRQLESNVEALFLTTARLARLTLTSFLR